MKLLRVPIWHTCQGHILANRQIWYRLVGTIDQNRLGSYFIPLTDTRLEVPTHKPRLLVMGRWRCIFRPLPSYLKNRSFYNILLSSQPLETHPIRYRYTNTISSSIYSIINICIFHAYTSCHSCNIIYNSSSSRKIS